MRGSTPRYCGSRLLNAALDDASNDGNNESADSSDDFVTVLRVFEKLK